jgi:tellurite resistance-related uncharacterized protein
MLVQLIVYKVDILEIDDKGATIQSHEWPCESKICLPLNWHLVSPSRRSPHKAVNFVRQWRHWRKQS